MKYHIKSDKVAKKSKKSNRVTENQNKLKLQNKIGSSQKKRAIKNLSKIVKKYNKPTKKNVIQTKKIDEVDLDANSDEMEQVLVNSEEIEETLNEHMEVSDNENDDRQNNEESNDLNEESNDLNEESNDVDEESNDVDEESNDIDEESNDVDVDEESNDVDVEEESNDVDEENSDDKTNDNKTDAFNFEDNTAGFEIKNQIEESDEDNDEEMELTDDDEKRNVDEEDEDLFTNIQTGENIILVTDLHTLQTRIDQNMVILENFKQFREKVGEKAKARSFYVNQWLEDLCVRYNYNKFLIHKLYSLYNLNLVKFIQASEEDRPWTVRSNSLKTTRKQLTENLINRDVNVDPLPFTKVGMVVYSTKCALGATPEYLTGEYILQGSSSMTPVIALAPKPGDMILDLCCAPGGKTTHLAQIMKNSGLIYANDISKERLKAVSGNLSRMGVTNTIVICSDGKKISSHLPKMDRVLVDAPCTGTGVISKDKNIKASKDESDIKMLSMEQKALVLAAADILKVGGYMVYSTCSVLSDENEEVVDYLMKNRKMKIVETGLPENFGIPGFVNFRSRHFDHNMIRTKRFYPHTQNMDGFYVAKLMKVAEMPKKKTEEDD